MSPTPDSFPSDATSLGEFLAPSESTQRSLAVLNRTEPEPFQAMIETLFEGQDVSVREAASDVYDEDTVVLVEAGEVIASSPLTELMDGILLVNSDLFITGTRSLEETTVPDVIDGLAGTRFSLRGYPESNSEKLLLILLSRYIERRAFEDGGGTLRSSFQRLSRVHNERGTKRVYERIAETDVDVHLYGRPDWYPSPEFQVVVHGGYTPDFLSTWFVLYSPPADSETEPAALLAIEREASTWDGFWTYDGEFVEAVSSYVRTNM